MTETEKEIEARIVRQIKAGMEDNREKQAAIRKARKRILPDIDEFARP
jgi:hypothetical protein